MKRSEWINLALIVTFSIFWALLGSMFGPYWDFIGFYNGATIAAQGDLAHLHDHAAQEAAQTRAVGQRGNGVTHFMRPQVYALVLAPLAWLPYKTAFGLWIFLQAALLAVCWTWGWKRFGSEAVVFASLWPVTTLGIAFGQDAGVYLALAVLSFAAWDRKRYLASGAALGAICLKPHLVLLIPLVLIVQRRWRMLFGFAAAALAEAAASIALGGFEAVPRYLSFVSSPDNHMLPERMVHIYSWLTNFGVEAGWPPRIALAALVVCAVVLVARSGQWSYGFAAGAFGSYLIAPHTYPYDMAMLLLPTWICLQTRENPPLRIAAALFLSPIPIGLQLLDAPWAVAPAAVLTAVLACLAWACRAGTFTVPAECPAATPATAA